MTVEELMKPRYKVIADYFFNPYKIGDIITVEYEYRSVLLTETYYRDEFGETVDQANYYNPNRLNDFPHLFRKLFWWEDRKPDEMPKYMKVIERINNHEDVGVIFPASPGSYRPFMKYGFTTNKYGYVSGFDNVIIDCFAPATKEEYEAFINKQ